MNIELLEYRLNELENLILGPNRSTSSVNKITTAHSTVHQKNPVDQLYELHSGLLEAEKRSNIGKLLGRINEIQKYIDPHFMEDDLLSAKSKIQIILTEKDKLEKMAQILENIQSLRDCLNHPVFSEISSMKARLENLRLISLDQHSESENLITQTQSLLDNYYNLVSNTSKLFIYWNQRAALLNSA